MNVDTWIGGCKVRAFPWVDGETIFFNVQYFAPGQSIDRPPVWDKTVYIKNNSAGQRVVREFTHTLVNYICMLTIVDGTKVVLTF